MNTFLALSQNFYLTLESETPNFYIPTSKTTKSLNNGIFKYNVLESQEANTLRLQDLQSSEVFICDIENNKRFLSIFPLFFY